MAVIGVIVGRVCPSNEIGAPASSSEDRDSVYKCPAFAGRDSLDTKPVTGSLHFATSRCHRLADFIAEGLVLCVSRDSAEFLLAIVCRVFRILLWHCSDTKMATGGDRRQVW